MNNEIKTKWVAALRGGEYKQARFALNTDGGMCCLGVLCDLYRKEHPDGPDWNFRLPLETDSAIPSVRREEVGFFDEEMNVLPPSVEIWAEVSSNNPTLHELATADRTSDDFPTSLANLNDDGLTFPQIADVIEHFL